MPLESEPWGFGHWPIVQQTQKGLGDPGSMGCRPSDRQARAGAGESTILRPFDVPGQVEAAPGLLLPQPGDRTDALGSSFRHQRLWHPSREARTVEHFKQIKSRILGRGDSCTAL